MTTETMAKKEVRWLTTLQALELLNISDSTLYRLVCEGVVRKHKLPGGRGVRYDREQLVQMMEDAGRPACRAKKKR